MNKLSQRGNLQGGGVGLLAGGRGRFACRGEGGLCNIRLIKVKLKYIFNEMVSYARLSFSG